MATQGGLPDDLLVNLAEHIETGEQMESLGRALGFSTAAINRYIATNRLEGRVTCKGTRDMLFDWRQTVEPCHQHLRLKEALIDSNLVMLADTHLKDIPSITGIYEKKISDSLSVKQCREKLKSNYLNSLCKIKLAPWDPNKYAEFKDMHTVVTMVKKDAYGRDTDKREILQGSVDEILAMKVNGVLPRRILISAPAGRGKTTAVAKMAYDWANRVQGSSLENLPLLFVVKLRNTNKLTSIAEAIRSQLLSDVDGLTEEELHKFIKDNQEICHIILDGLDEYAGIVANRGLGSNIVDVMLWKEYRECRVLVTTRPHLENFFNEGELPIVYTKMWIEGFSQKSSRDYIDKFFSSTSNPSKGQGLKTYLSGQPLINELVITPLFCLMVCHLWSEDLLGSRTKTQTDLLDSVNVFLMHHANARSKSNYKITHDKLSKTICKLGKVALTGLLDDSKKLVFTPRDFWWVPAILERACELGILSKTTTQLTGLPQSHETSSTSIEFYHKLAQEHSAGKYLANQTNKYLLRWKISKLDRVLQKIRANIGDYENLIRFTAGTKNSLCIRIMEAILDNSVLDESERYRILFDCSSETEGTEQGVSSLVQRCVPAQCILLKSPTVYTVVGIKNLPVELKKQVRQVRLEGSAVSIDVTNDLWSCLESFSTLHTVTILDSSLSFSLSPPELPSVTKLEAERVTSQSYERMLSSMPSLKEIHVTIYDDVEGSKSQNTASRPMSHTGDKSFLVQIHLEFLQSRSTDEKIESRETVAELGLLNKGPTGGRQWLQVSGMKGQDEEVLVNLFLRTSLLNTMNLEFSGSVNSSRRALNIHALTIKHCKLIDQMTDSMWSCLRSVTTPLELTITDSSLSFSPSPPVLPSVAKLVAKRVTSSSYESLLSSLSGVEEIEVIIDDAQKDISQITAGLCQSGGQNLKQISLEAPPSLQPEKKEVSRGTMRRLGVLIREQTKNLKMLVVSGVNSRCEEDLVALIECCRHVMALDYLLLLGCGSTRGGRLESYTKDLLISKERLKVLISHEMSRFDIEELKLSTEMTTRLWSSLSFFTSLRHLFISNSSLLFPPFPPELTSVTKLKAERVTLQSYEGLLSSLPGLEEIDITIDDAERDISQITAGLRRTGWQQLTRIALEAPAPLPLQRKRVSIETLRGLSLLIREDIKSLQSLSVSGVKCLDGDCVDIIECSKILPSLHFEFLGWGSFTYNAYAGPTVTIAECQLSTEMTIRLWTCLTSFTSLGSLTISHSSLSFSPTPPELTSVISLRAEGVTSQSYGDLLSSLPGLKMIDITIDGCAERDKHVAQITAVLHRTAGQRLTHIYLHASDSHRQVKKNVSRETVRGLGLLIREQTKNLQRLRLYGVKCTDEEDLVYLIKCCRHVTTMEYVWLHQCGTQASGRLESNLKRLHSSDYPLSVHVTHDNGGLWQGKVSHIH